MGIVKLGGLGKWGLGNNISIASCFRSLTEMLQIAMSSVFSVFGEVCDHVVVNIVKNGKPGFFYLEDLGDDCGDGMSGGDSNLIKFAWLPFQIPRIN
jgi:hypothetical protein